MRIKISTTVRWPIERQIPPRWANTGMEVFINRPVDWCDLWVVYQGLLRPDEAMVPPERVVFFSYEPPGLHSYQSRFLAQFAKIVTCQQNIQHPGRLLRHQAQPWIAGVDCHPSVNLNTGFGINLRYEDFERMAMPAKSRPLSVVCSRKAMVPGHQLRLEFVQALQQQAGGDVEVFGYGFQPVVDKWQALAPYRYHLVLENSILPHYWTEKVSDAFLAWCVPIVWGCPNLSEYFPEKSFIALDPADMAASLQTVARLIQQPPTPEQLAAVEQARRLVLEKYNLFPELQRLAESIPSGPARRVRLRDERLFLPGGFLRPLLRLLTDRWRFHKRGA